MEASASARIKEKELSLISRMALRAGEHSLALPYRPDLDDYASEVIASTYTDWKSERLGLAALVAVALQDTSGVEAPGEFYGHPTVEAVGVERLRDTSAKINWWLITLGDLLAADELDAIAMDPDLVLELEATPDAHWSHGHVAVGDLPSVQALATARAWVSRYGHTAARSRALAAVVPLYFEAGGSSDDVFSFVESFPTHDRVGCVMSPPERQEVMIRIAWWALTDALFHTHLVLRADS